MAALAVEGLANAAVNSHSDSFDYIDAFAAAAGDIALAVAVAGDAFAAAAALVGAIALVVE